MATHGDDDAESSDVDWLDLGARSGSPDRGSPRRPSRRWFLLVLLGVLGVAAAVAIQHRSTRPSAAHRPPTSVASTLQAPATQSTPLPLGVSELGHPLLGVPAGWELFGEGSGTMVRIQLDLGRITRTAVPSVTAGSFGGVSFVVGPDRAIVASQDTTTAYVVRDGQQAWPTPNSFNTGPVFPGPDSQHVWADAGEEANQGFATTQQPSKVVVLASIDGTRTTQTIQTIHLPAGSGLAASDGAGYLVFANSSGAYDATPTSRKLITTGTLLAVGPTRWLTVECDRQNVCSTVVIDRHTGARHVIGGPSDTSGPRGLISPDGNTAALISRDTTGNATLHLRDLGTDADRPVAASLDSSVGENSATLIWSPDSRWLFTIDSGSHIVLIDERMAQVRQLGVALPRVEQLGLRISSR